MFVFLVVILIVWLLPFEERGLGFKFLSTKKFAGFCIGCFLAWAIGFCDDNFQLRARWKLTGQIAIALMAVGIGFEIKIVQIPFLQILSVSNPLLNGFIKSTICRDYIMPKIERLIK